MKNIGLTGYVYDFSINCNAVTVVNDIKNIQIYLMKKSNMIP